MELRITELDRLGAELGPGTRSLISIVGGGGKTTTLFALGRQLPGSTIMTTTTKMGSERDDGVAVLLAPNDDELDRAVREHSRVLVWSDRGDHRATGISPDLADRWYVEGRSDHIVVEADGSRGRPFKAPYPYEPVVPKESTIVIACIGVSALDQPIDQACLRPDAVAALLDVEPTDLLTPARAAAVLQHPNGSRKSAPAGARFVVCVQNVSERDTDRVVSLLAALGDSGEVPDVLVVGRHEDLPSRPSVPKLD